MSDCPQCGAPAQATTTDDATGQDFFEDGNGHMWPADGED